MPQLGNEPEIKEVVLPSTKDLPKDEQAIIWFDVSPRKAGDYYSVKQQDHVGNATFAVLMARTKDWNYTDANGQKLPINVENFGRLNAGDFAYLQELVTDGSENLIDEAKKNESSSISSPAVNEPTVS